ncbi:hypothetical protein ExPECSC054_2326 [Escherichia coli]|nr:hypothetical protein ExPECSC054_2326 [Escherichia coli]
MKIFLENLYHSDCYFLPIRDNQQDLVGVELITHFSSEDGTVRIPTSRVIAQLTEEQHWQLFSEQLELLKSCQHFFIQHKLFAWEGANKRGNSSRLTQSFHFFMFEPIFSPVNALNQPI